MLNSYAKKTNKTSHKTKTQESERWDHGGWDQMQQQELNDYWSKGLKNPRKQYKSKKQNKEGLFNHENECIKKDKKSNQDHMKWQHDKFEELQSKSHSSSIYNNGQNIPKTDRKIDQQVYYLKENQNKSDDLISNKSTMVASSLSNIDTSKNQNKTNDAGTGFLKKPSKDISINLNNDKEGLAIEDDKSSISNVSTAISDRHKIWDEDTILNNSKAQIKNFLKDQTPKTTIISDSNSEKNLNFLKSGYEIRFQNGENAQVAFIHDNEEDYESILDKICKQNNIKDHFAIRLKIYILKNMKDSNPFDLKIDSLYNKLLDLNFKLIFLDYKNEKNMDIDHNHNILLPYSERNNNNVNSSMEHTKSCSIIFENNQF